MKRYGLSLSFCLPDLLSGEVSLSSFAGIISATRFETPEQALEHYMDSYWSDLDRASVRTMLEAIWPKVVQPRLSGLPAHNIARGKWMVVPKGLVPVLVQNDEEGSPYWTVNSNPGAYLSWAALIDGEIRQVGA